MLDIHRLLAGVVAGLNVCRFNIHGLAASITRIIAVVPFVALVMSFKTALPIAPLLTLLIAGALLAALLIALVVVPPLMVVALRKRERAET